MTSCFILVDQTFSGHTIQQWLCSVKRLLSVCFIASRDSCKYFFHVSANHRTTAGIVLTAFLRLKRAFLSRLDISQGKTPKTVLASENKRPRNMPFSLRIVNWFVQINIALWSDTEPKVKLSAEFYQHYPTFSNFLTTRFSFWVRCFYDQA